MRDFTYGNVPRQIFHFSVPIILGSFLQQLYNIVDSIIVGQFVGPEALAGVGASFPIIFLLISLVVGVSNGATIIISQYFGAKEFSDVQKTIDTTNIFLFFSSIVISILGICFSREIFQLIELPDAAMNDAITYLDIYLLGLSGLFGYYGLCAVLRGMGDSKTPLYAQLYASVLNAILGVVLVIVFHAGVAGVAIATIVSQGATFVGLAWYLNKRHKYIKVILHNISFDWEIFRQSIRIGLPSGLQQSFVGLGTMAVVWIVNGFGTEAIAAYSVASRIDMLATMPAMNFAQGLSTFVGQNMGANKIERARQGYRSTLLMTALLSIVLLLVIVLFRHPIMSLFSPNQNIVNLGADYLLIVSPFYICFSVLFVSNGALRGAGDTLIPMFITLFSLWAVRIPLSYYLSKGIGVNGIWWGVPSGWIVGMLLSYWYYQSGRWMNKTVVRCAVTPS